MPMRLARPTIAETLPGWWGQPGISSLAIESTGCAGASTPRVLREREAFL